MTTTPGYGTERLHVRQSSSILAKALGAPAKRRKSSALREYWIYPKQRFEAIVSRRSHRLLSLFFHRGSALAGGEFFGQSEFAIRRQFGEPHKQGGGITFEDGDSIGRWLSYRSGIAFFFDREGKVTTVCIRARSRAAAAKPAASHREHYSQKVAALVSR